MGQTGEHAPQSFTGFDRLADRAVAWLAGQRRAAREREAARRAENPPPLFPRKRWDATPPERRAELWAVHDKATEAALGSPSIMTYGAAAARLGDAGRFAAMSRRGAGDAAIRRATRYERGPFGYGVETRGDAALRPAAVFGAVREGSLGELAYVHPEVARAYPTMRDVKVEMVPSAEWAERLAAAKAASAEAGGAGSTGAYAKATDTILVKGPSEAEPLHMFADRADRTLVHEMQHAAQARDGLLGRTAGDYRTAAKEVDARNSANRRWLGPAERREMPRANTQDVRPEEVHMDDKGGEDVNGRHGNFTNFLATDDVPKSIFGIPIVQDESGYTERDVEFFRENPKAAGFYEMGDEEVDKDAPQQAAGAGATYDTPLTADQEAKYQKWRATLPKPLQYEGDYDLRGYWLDPETVKDGIKDGQHFTDTYKKPNHPTFSVESKYAVGADLARAGRWEGEKFIPPRGMYPGSLNNPGNVEKRKERRQGEVDSPHERWAKFATPQDGLREMADAIRQIAEVKLAEKGLPFTIRNFAGVYAPSTENDTAKYVADISADSGFGSDEELHRFDEGDMARLLKSVVRFESGALHSAWFTDEEYAEAAKKLQEGAVD